LYAEKNNYMMSIAFTKAVVWKGRMRVSQGQCEQIARARAAVDARKINHHTPLYFFVCSMI
jgi:hypothetical protein